MKVKMFKLCCFLFVIFLLTACGFFGDKSFAPKLIPVKAGEKWGYVDKEGKYLINPQFTYADYFVDNIAVVSSSDKFGFIDENGKYIVNPQYKYASNFSEDLACVVPENGKIKYIDKSGQLKFELQDAEFAGNFHNGMAKVKIKDKWGFIDKTGKILINPQFDFAEDFTEELSAVMRKSDKDESLWGFIDKTGKIIINPQFKSVNPFTEKIAVVSSDGKLYGFIDKTGKYIINPQFEEVTNFNDGIAAVKQGTNWGIIDKTGKIIVNPQFQEVQLPKINNLIAVKSDNKWGFINIEGKYEINPQFDKVSNFIGDVAIADISGKTGFIDTKGKYTANPQFDDFKSPFYYSFFGAGYSFSVLSSDFFDIELFAGKILSKNKILQIDSNTTVKEVSSLFNLKDDDFSSKGVEIKNNGTLDSVFSTKDIIIKKAVIYFADNTYRSEDKYENYQDYWGTNRRRWAGSTKILNNDVKSTGVEIDLTLVNRGEGKGKTLADNIKSKLIKMLNLKEINHKKLEEEKTFILHDSNNNYYAYITYKDNKVTFYLSYSVGVVKKIMEQIDKWLLSNQS